MNGQSDIIARVRFFPTSEGGRQGATPEKMFGCPFVFKEEMFDCRLFLEGVGSVSPGDEVEVPIAFLCPNLIKPRLNAGDRFALWEMGTIADGEVREVLS